MAEHPLDQYEQVVFPGGQQRGIVNLSWACTEFAKAGWLVKGDGPEEKWSAAVDGLKALIDFPDPNDLAREARARYSV
ncbi:hypothetical protein JF66_22345, partial [Cryobacterium sp. MLB-32]